jgi:hypothetical protein
MFVDVCFPKGNEEEFIGVARLIGTDALCFIYDKVPKIDNAPSALTKEFRTYVGSTKQGSRILFSDNLVLSQKNVIFYYIPKKEESRFNMPIRSITQVTLNNIKEHNGCIGISLSGLIRSRCFEEAVHVDTARSEEQS